MTRLTARDIMFPRVSLPAKERGEDVVKRLMVAYPALPVVNDNLEVIGIVSDYDVLHAIKEKRTIHEFSAESIMSCGHAEHDVCATPLTVTPDTSIDQIVNILYNERVMVLPVVENRKLVGLLTRKSVVMAVAERGFRPEVEFQKRAA